MKTSIQHADYQDVRWPMILSGAWKLPKMEKCWNNPSKQCSLLPPRRCINYQYLHNETDVYSWFWLLSSQQCNVWGGNDYHGRNTMDTICNLYKTIQKKVQNYPEKSNETQYSAHRRKYFLASYEKGDQLLQFSAPHNNLERKGN